MKDLLQFLDRYKMYHIGIENLWLDSQNPRLSEENQGKEQSEILETMFQEFSLEELAFSLARNGYFQEEPLVAIPNNKKDFENFDFEDSKPEELLTYIVENNIKLVIVEGNRRLSTIILLLDEGLRAELGVKNWPIPDKPDSLNTLPIAFYPDRKSVATYIGIRHIGGFKKWEPYEKARYIQNLIEIQKIPIDLVQQMVGDRGNSIRKSYLCYKLLQIIDNNYDIPQTVDKAKNLFSYLQLSIGSTSVKAFLEIDRNYKQIDFENPLPEKKHDDLKLLFSWLFGEGKLKPAVISESRDITNLLDPVLRSDDSILMLRQTRNLYDAYEISDGEKELLMKHIKNSNKSLGNVASLMRPDLTDQVFIDQFQIVENQVAKIKAILSI